MIYFTSDLHLGHKFVLEHRKMFSDIDGMNRELINNINEKLTRNDTLYILGDASYRLNPDEASVLLRKIKCRKILIRGNHDKEYDPDVFEEVSDYLELKYNKHKFILCHYPFVCWKQMRHGSINLHGHIHSDPEYNEENRATGRLQYDVGVDANGYKPVSIDRILNWAASSPWEEYKGLNHHITEETADEKS